MEGIEVIFWVILALIWLISGGLLRKRALRERERMQKEGAAHTEPEEEKEGIFPEEEARNIFEISSLVLPSVEEPQLVTPIEEKEEPKIEFMAHPVLPTGPEEEEREIELEDLESLGQGILLSEIIGPPRAKKPFRRIC